MIAEGDFVPILILTAATSEQIKRKALECGAADFLTKPFDAVELSLRVQNLLARRLLHQELKCQNQTLELKVQERTEELAQSREQFRALAVNLASMLEEERTQISRDVHDVLGQALTSLKMDVAWLAEYLPDSAAGGSTSVREKTGSISRLIDSTIQSVQRIATQLRPRITLGIAEKERAIISSFEASGPANE